MDTPSSADANRSHEAALRLLGVQDIRIDELESENASLRAELAALRKEPSEAPSAVSAERFDTLQRERDELEQAYLKLEQHYAKRKSGFEHAERKYQRAREILAQWRAYYDRKMDEHKKKMDLDPELRRDVSIKRPSNLDPADDCADLDGHETPRPLRTTSEEMLDRGDDILALPVTLAEDHTSENQASKRVTLTSRTLRVSSSQTTDAGSDPAEFRSSSRGKHEPSSDGEPIVVSTRALKRKRGGSVLAMPPPVRIKQEPNSPEKPIEIRSEDFSSPVLKRQYILRQETSDLDAFTEVYNTPRRQRAARRAMSAEFTRPPALATRVSSLSEGDIQEDDVAHIKPEYDGGGTETGTRPRPPVSAADLNQQRGGTRASEDVLRTLSVNIPAKRPSATSLSTKNRRQRYGNSAARVAMLSEDGETDGLEPKRPKVKNAEDKATPRAEASRRLDTMLDEPPTDTRRLVRDLTPQSAVPKSRRPLTPVSDPRPASKYPKRASPKKHAQAPTPMSRPRPRVSPPPRRAEHRFKRPQGVEDSPPPVRPEEEPLRLRPVGSLRLEDFKVNPKFMGADFAYVDNLRGRDQRRGMHTCTKPDCCGGKFLQAAEIDGHGGSNKSDAEVLEDYMGPNWQQMMGALARDRRDDMLKQARAAQFANKYGKHRHAFERHSTPPGFWRVDMPTTQEEAEDRVKADQIIRQKVEERWREAIRDGDGRWLFRDE